MNTKQKLDTLIFSMAIDRIDKQYGIRNQFTIEGTSIDNFMLVPRIDRGYDEQDMRNLAVDADFMAEAIKHEVTQ